MSNQFCFHLILIVALLQVVDILVPEVVEQRLICLNQTEVEQEQPIVNPLLNLTLYVLVRIVKLIFTFVATIFYHFETILNYD